MSMIHHVYLTVYLFNNVHNTFFSSFKISKGSQSVLDIIPATVLTPQLKEGRKEGRTCFYLMMHSTHFIYGYMASDICKGPLR